MAQPEHLAMITNPSMTQQSTPSTARHEKATVQKDHDIVNKSYPFWQRFLEITALSLCALSISCFLLYLSLHVSLIYPARFRVLVSIPLAYLITDLLSGTIHWAMDNWGSDTAPFVAPFRRHHLHPEEITQHDFVELNGNTCLVGLLATLLAWLSLLIPDTPWLATAVFLQVTLVFGVLTNSIHAWAHTSKNELPKILRFAQESNIILNRRHHQEHHRAPHHKNYAITNGLTNGVCDRFGYYEFLGKIVTSISGQQPRHKSILEETIQKNSDSLASRP
ncbi:MAG: fatty acid desaturase family protein [Polyangiaceae bacterium]|nr:fatty acid desaturase family protein [Polyangiaceae bacterium]